MKPNEHGAILGDEIIINAENADQFAPIIGQPLAELLKNCANESETEAQVFVVTSVSQDKIILTGEKPKE